MRIITYLLIIRDECDVVENMLGWLIYEISSGGNTNFMVQFVVSVEN